MTGTISISREVPVRWSVDLLVVGGGSAGCAAALAAARRGLDVAVVERYGFLGGTGASVLDTFYGFFTPGPESRKVVGGIPDDVVAILGQHGAMIERANTYGAGKGITYHPELLKVAWDELLAAAGVRVLLGSFVIDAVVEHGAVRGAILANKAGVEAIRATVVVDASGDADVAASAGAPYERIGERASVQSLTTTFSLVNVDSERADAVAKEELWSLMRAATAGGSFRLPRVEGSVHRTPHPGVVATNMTRVRVEDPTDPVLLSAAEVEGRRQALEYARFMRERVPGYERSVLGSFSTQIGVRETRRIDGEYRLTRADVLAARQFPDAIAVCGAPIEDHHSGTDTAWEYVPGGGTYGIPYRCLLPKDVEGLLVAGRCLSAEHEAHASVRSIGQCMAMGQAAGVAAALAVEGGVEPRDVPIEPLRMGLLDLGAILS